MNEIMIAGHIGKDAERVVHESGQVRLSFNVGSTTKRGQESHTDWYRCTYWGSHYDKMAPHLKKGSAVIVWGTLKTSLYDKVTPPKINLDINVDSIKFSPFGKREDSKPSVADDGGKVYNSPKARDDEIRSGKGQADNFQDEELPF